MGAPYTCSCMHNWALVELAIVGPPYSWGPRQLPSSPCLKVGPGSRHREKDDEVTWPFAGLPLYRHYLATIYTQIT